MARVVLENVGKLFGEIVAVNDFNLSIEDKEFVVLVGPSGCGKTTTLRMIAGLEKISSGRILIEDRLINALPAKERNIAMVFQNYALYPHMTVFQNMAFSLEMRERSKEKIRDRVQKAAEILDIQHLLQRRPKQLSGGQRQRVAVGRAIVRKPDVFLFDEPLSNLDAKLRVQMRVELRKLQERLATTSVYVTHDQVEAMTMGDRIVVMKDGLIQQIGNPLELYNQPVNKFVAGFLGSPAMNFIEAKVSVDRGTPSLQCEDFRLDLPPDMARVFKSYPHEAVIVGIRPEDFHLVPDHVDGRTIQVEIEVVEPIGNETYVFTNSGHISLTAGVGRNTPARAHQNIVLEPLDGCLHLFDVESEKTLPDLVCLIAGRMDLS